MGGGNVLKKINEATVGAIAKPFRETANMIGAKGLVKSTDKFLAKDKVLFGGLVDKASGRASRLKNEANDMAAAANASAAAEAKRNAASAASAAEAAREAERMSGGSSSRTLLTGGTGLDDEEETISRRTLRGF